MTRELKIYLLAVALLSLGMHVHVILFNLYLSDLGHRENTMGRLMAVFTAGTAVGTLAGAALARRRGLKLAIVLSAAGLAVSLAFRATAAGSSMLTVSFAAGFFLGGWFVTNAPAIASLAGSDPRAYSLNAALAIGVGAAAGLLAGQLPRWFPSASPDIAKHGALLVAAAFVAAGAVIASRVTFTRPAASITGREILLLRHSVARLFLLRFLLAVAPWYAFANGLIPFLNIYLQNRLGASLEAIGGIFALAQISQAAAVLLMAPVIARFGLRGALVVTQLLAAASVFGLIPVHSLAAASSVYLLSLSLYVMTEPALQNLLMSGVPAHEREAASAANLLLMFLIQSAVAGAVGGLIAYSGYGMVFALIGGAGIIAALLSSVLFARQSFPGMAPAASAADSSGAPPG